MLRTRPGSPSTSRCSEALTCASLTLLLLAGCSEKSGESSQEVDGGTAEIARNPLKDAYFGDLHVHTRFSFDAFIFNVRATPEDAYRYAKGEAIDHPAGYKIQLGSGPLDFYAVTDHSEYLGVIQELSDPDSRLYSLPIAAEVRGDAGQTIRERFDRVAQSLGAGELLTELDAPDVNRSAWEKIIAAAEKYNDPGHFTTFVAYEYTSPPEAQNLHRNVIFRGSKVPDLPFSSLDSQNPEDLWNWLDGLRSEGIEVLAIPHNSNGSNGQMFKLEKFEGQPFDADYAEQRMRNEPLVEVSQVKGTSETHPMLSPNDEWASFEIYPLRIGSPLKSDVPGSYVREAYLHGLELEESRGFNPFKFGLIGSSDTHNGGSPVEEDNFFGKVGVADGLPQRRGSVPLDQPLPDGSKYADTYFDLWGASGLAGVWAEANTRDDLFDAMRRKETFASSGPRIRVRFFAGFDLPADLDKDPDLVARAYQTGVPMGADLESRAGASPRFLAWAMRDPRSAPLQRLQVIKGWVEDGKAKEQVFDVACSDGLVPDQQTHRCPDNGAQVDLSSCAISDGLGASELRTVWTDPAYDPGQRAFYYVRVLENPTCRWSTWDAIRAGVEPRPSLPKTIQERAWTSPIWLVPGI